MHEHFRQEPRKTVIEEQTLTMHQRRVVARYFLTQTLWHLCTTVKADSQLELRTSCSRSRAGLSAAGSAASTTSSAEASDDDVLEAMSAVSSAGGVESELPAKEVFRIERLLPAPTYTTRVASKSVNEDPAQLAPPERLKTPEQASWGSSGNPPTTPSQLPPRAHVMRPCTLLSDAHVLCLMAQCSEVASGWLERVVEGCACGWNQWL